MKEILADLGRVRLQLYGQLPAAWNVTKARHWNGIQQAKGARRLVSFRADTAESAC